MKLLYYKDANFLLSVIESSQMCLIFQIEMFGGVMDKHE